jgi:hypothetical protein
MKKLNYDRITTTIEREWLASLVEVWEETGFARHALAWF